MHKQQLHAGWTIHAVGDLSEVPEALRDVVAVGNESVLLYHEDAWLEPQRVLENIAAQLPGFRPIMIVGSLRERGGDEYTAGPVSLGTIRDERSSGRLDRPSIRQELSVAQVAFVVVL